MTSPAAEAQVAELPFTIKEKLLALENALKAQNPGYSTILDFLHTETHKHPEYVYALSDEEMAMIFQGYERWTKITIDVGKMTKKKAATVTADDV